MNLQPEHLIVTNPTHPVAVSGTGKNSGHPHRPTLNASITGDY